MSKPTPLYRNLILDHAIAEGCPAEVTKEATELVADGHALTTIELDTISKVCAYAYTAGRVARWDALVKGSPRLIDAIMKSVHEFFHDEPFGGHDGTADECTDCSTVSALAADAAAAFYQALPGTPDVYVEDEAEVLDGDDPDFEYPPDMSPEDREIERLSARAEQGYDETQLLPQVPGRALTTSVPDEWRKDA